MYSKLSDTTPSSQPAIEKGQLPVHIIDPANHVKHATKTNIIATVKRTMGPLLGGAASYSMCAIDLPISTIRDLTSIWYKQQSSTNTAIQTFIDTVPNKQRSLVEHYLAYMKRIMSNSDAPRFLFTYSIQDKVVDCFNRPI